MSSLKTNTTCPLLEDYLNYLIVIKGRSTLTAFQYRIDCLMFLEFMKQKRGEPLTNRDFSGVDINFIKSISLTDMYAFITHCQQERGAVAGTRARKIVSIRQFWKYLKTKAHLLENNVAEELETPKLPKRMPKYMSLEESIRLLIECEASPRDHCIITLFLNCALRLSELISINLEQVTSDTLYIVGKGEKMRIAYLSPSAKKSITDWLAVRDNLNPQCNALFVTKLGTRVTCRGVQDIVKKYIKKAGMGDRQLSPHKLRHTAATLMYTYGKCDLLSLSEILGHESVSTTQLYTHVSTEKLQSTVNSNPLASMFRK